MNAWVGRKLTFQQKRKLSFSMCFIANFLGGTESAIILPTVWMYLQKLGVQDEKYMGYVISAFTFSGMLSGLAVGRIVDLTDNVRFVVLSLNLCQVFGQFLYFWGISANSLILARFLCGIGIGINSAFYSEIARGTSRNERSRMITWAFVMRQLSIILAPGYNLVLAKIPPVVFRVGPVTLSLTEESAPGALLCLLWTLFELLLFFGYFNMAEEFRKYKEEKRAAKRGRTRRSRVEQMPQLLTTLSSENTPLLMANGGVGGDRHRRPPANGDTSREKSATAAGSGSDDQFGSTTTLVGTGAGSEFGSAADVREFNTRYYCSKPPQVTAADAVESSSSSATGGGGRVRWIMDLSGPQGDGDDTSLFTPAERDVVSAPMSETSSGGSRIMPYTPSISIQVATSSSSSSGSSLTDNEDEAADAFCADAGATGAGAATAAFHKRSLSGSIHKSSIGSVSSATLSWAHGKEPDPEADIKDKRKRKVSRGWSHPPEILRAPSEDASVIAGQMLSGSLDQDYSRNKGGAEDTDSELYAREFLNPRIVMLMYLMVVGFLAQTMVETIIPPLMQEYFGYTSTENSFIFMAVGGEALLVYAVILNCSRKVDPGGASGPDSAVSFTKTFGMDVSTNKPVVSPKTIGGRFKVLTERGVIAFSCCALCVALTGFLAIGAFLEPGKTELLVPFLVMCGITFLALPAAMVSCVSLLTICLDHRVQGLGQGIRRFCDYLGNILGPLWGGALVFHPFPLFGVVLILVGIQIGLLCLTYRDLNPRAEQRRRVLSMRPSTATRNGGNIR